MPFQSTIGICDAHMAFEQPPECEGSTVDIPDAVVDFLEADIFPGTGDGDVDPATVPPEATVGADIAHLEAVGILEGWQFVGHRPGGRCIAGGRGAPVERLMRALMVELLADVVELLLLCAPGGAGRSGGVGLQRAMQALVATVLVRFTGFDDRRQDAQADPPCGQPGEPGQGVGGERHAIVRADTLGQAACFEHAREDWFGLRDARRRQGLAAEENAAVTIGDGQRIAVAAVASLEVSFAVRTSHVVGRIHGTGGCARMPNDAALALRGHQAVAAEHVTDGRARRPGPARMALTQDR